jgi:ABC-type nitrate/sulfonate/bicarbonate transport system permease component
VSERAAAHLTQIAVVGVLLVLWQLAATVWGVNPLLLPAPLPVLAAFWQLVVSGAFLPDLELTLFELAAAFLIAAAAGGIIGYLVSRSSYAVEVFNPLFTSLYSIPSILLFPLYVIYFGLGPGSKIAMGTSIAFFPIVLSTVAGLAYVDAAYVGAARSMGASRWQMFRSVLAPAAFPVLLTGLRLGFILAFLAILGAETIASFAGLGHQIVSLAEALDTTQMFAYILLVILVAVVLNAAVSFIEARGRWAPA